MRNRAIKSSFIHTVSTNYQCIYSIPFGSSYCLLKQCSAYIINHYACIINVGVLREFFLTFYYSNLKSEKLCISGLFILAQINDIRQPDLFFEILLIRQSKLFFFFVNVSHFLQFLDILNELKKK